MTTEKSGSVTSPLSTHSSIPALHAFDQRTSTWQSYRDRLHFYFKANQIEADDDKKSLFLWSVGDGTYPRSCETGKMALKWALEKT